jgi:hypothetical protein
MHAALTLAGFLIALVPLGPMPLSAGDIAQRHVAAIGGYASVKALTSIACTGVYTESGFRLAASQTYMRPYYEVVDPHLKPVIEEGFDGRPWEYYAEYGVVLRTAGPPGMATTHASEFDDSLVDFAAKGSRIAITGSTRIQDRQAFDVLVTLRDGFAKHVYVDEKTYLILGSRKTAKVHAFGAKVTSQTLIGGYRRVAGVLLPTTFREVGISAGRELNRLTWTEIVANRPLPVSLFSPPRCARSSLSSLLEYLYSHRAEATRDEIAYRDFRRRFPHVNSEPGIEFIAYQILKTGVSGSAIALLSANVHDYPRSADAQFGLGRAYRAAGIELLAVAAFRHALHLRPNDARALEALKQSDRL